MYACLLFFFFFLKWQVGNLCTWRSHSSTFLKANMSIVSFRIWRIIVIELHKQPAEEVRFTVTSRHFSLGNKESGKRDCDRSSVAYWNKSPNWMIYLFPLFEAEKCCLPTASVWVALVEYLGRAALCKTVVCEALVPIFSLCTESTSKREREYSSFGLRLSCVGLPEREQSAWDIFETQMHFVTEEKNRWEVMASHEN